MPFTGVVVDDADSDLEYIGPWFTQDSTSMDSWGNYGPTMKGSMHGTKENASFTYKFSGTSISVVGTTQIRNDSGVIDPQWECFVDDVSIGSSPVWPYQQNSFEWCSNSQLSDGGHVIRLEAKVAKEQTFWFDFLNYAPSSTVDMDNAAVIHDHTEPTVQYSSGWQTGQWHITQQTNAKAIIYFNGTSLAWSGAHPPGFASITAPATYSVDGQTPVPFSIDGLSGTVTHYNAPIFKVGSLSPGPHTLEVVYKGDTDSSPLTLGHYLVQNAPFSASAASSSSIPSATPVPSPSLSPVPLPSKHINIGVIAGGVVGGLTFIILALFLFFFLRQRRRSMGNSSLPISLNQTSSRGGEEIVQPFVQAPLSTSKFGSATQLVPTRRPSQHPITRKQQQAEADPYPRVPVTVTGTSRPGPPGLSPYPTSVSSGSSRVVLHEDSGIRMGEHGQVVQLVDIPPQYTPG